MEKQGLLLLVVVEVVVEAVVDGGSGSDNETGNNDRVQGVPVKKSSSPLLNLTVVTCSPWVRMCKKDLIAARLVL